MKKALGRGLGTLLPSRVQEQPAAPARAPESGVQQLSIGKLAPNPYQPRRSFDKAQLEELAQSIRADGVIQPLVVRASGDGYQIVAGERRWRAAQIAGLTSVPVHIQNFADDRMLEVALIENIQRADLNAIETAVAFQRLHEELGLSHEEIGRRTGKDRVTISNTIRLLQLPPDLQKLVAEGILSAGHARALLKIDDPDEQRRIAKRASDEQWPVRRLEAETTRPTEGRQKEERSLDPNTRAALEQLEQFLGTRVRLLQLERGRGKLEIEFSSQDELQRIYEAIVEAPE